MPPTPRPKQPWFLDALRWIRGLAPAADRDVIDLVRLDLDEDLGEQIAEGVPRWRAYRTQWRRVRQECGVFLARAGRSWKARTQACLGGGARHVRRLSVRVARPAVGVGLAGAVLLSATWLWFDRAEVRDLVDVRRQLQEMREQLEDTQASLRQVESSRPAGHVITEISQDAEKLIARMSDIQGYLERTERAYPGQFYLTGLVGLIDQELALFWEARGDTANSESHWRAALSAYAKGARDGDPGALLHLGSWHLRQGDPSTAVDCLKKAHELWYLLGLPREEGTGVAEAKYHYALLELWKAEQNPAIAVEAHPLEAQALEDLEQGAVKETTHEILYNAACLRALMMQAGARKPVEGIRAIELLHRAFDAGVESGYVLAHGVLSDPDLAALRSLPNYEGLASRAKAILDENRQPTERKN